MVGAGSERGVAPDTLSRARDGGVGETEAHLRLRHGTRRFERLVAGLRLRDLLLAALALALAALRRDGRDTERGAAVDFTFAEAEVRLRRRHAPLGGAIDGG